MILDDLAAHARERTAQARAVRPFEDVREAALALARREPAGAFRAALAKPGLSFVCEIKHASPSKGLIAPEFPYEEIARGYEAAGAECISCLTEPKWFLGSDEIFRAARAVQSLPMLRKDFTVDAYQIYEAKVLGAQAALLIVSLLDDATLARFLEACAEAGLDALVECHNEEEIRRAVAAGARIVGVNNRDLRDFSVDFDNARRLRELVPPEAVYVAESGVRSAEDVARVAAMGADAVLVGEALMRAEDRAATLAAFRAAAEEACR